jgi:hypothetical protein
MKKSKEAVAAKSILFLTADRAYGPFAHPASAKEWAERRGYSGHVWSFYPQTGEMGDEDKAHEAGTRLT